MKNKIDLIEFYKIFSMALVIIVIGLIFYITSNQILNLSDSFYGALLGALISGGSAILVFKLGEISKERERQLQIEVTKKKTIKRLIYVNENLLIFIKNFQSRFSTTTLRPLKEDDEQAIESYIKRLKRLIEILEAVDTNEFDEEISEEFYKYKLQIVLVYDEMYRLFYGENKKYRELNYTNIILKLLNHVENDISNFENYLQLRNLY